jgi:hypothetical protein
MYLSAMTRQPRQQHSEQFSEAETAKRADEGLRRALSTPPKQHKDMKKGKGKKRQEDRPTASDAKRD